MLVDDNVCFAVFVVANFSSVDIFFQLNAISRSDLYVCEVRNWITMNLHCVGTILFVTHWRVKHVSFVERKQILIGSNYLQLFYLPLVDSTEYYTVRSVIQNIHEI